MARLTFAAVAAAVAAASARPTAQATLDEAWRAVGPATAKTTVTVALKQSNEVLDALHRTFVAVSTPGSPQYANYLSFDELNELVRVAEPTRTAALHWCDTHGFECTLGGTGDMLRVTAAAPAIGAALNVELKRYVHAATTSEIVRTPSTVTPAADMPWADCIMGLNTFPDMVRAKATAGAAVTPALLKSSTLYNITEVATPNSASSMAVAEFQGQGYLPSDLAKFEEKYNLPSQKVRNLTGSPDGDKSAGTEAELDIQYIIATGTGVPADFYLHAGNDFDLAGWAAAVLADPYTALVWSVSYGEGINGGVGGVVQPSYAKALNIQFEKFGVRGISVLIASGDSGVYNRKPLDVEKFHPSFPACLPAATAVGSTELTSVAGAVVEDSAVSFSGGGFTPSEYFTRDSNASYQAALVTAYLNSGVELPPSHLWDQAGRGLPDVSTVGVDFEVVVGGQVAGVSGTSASTPTFAGIVALVNDKLMAAGKKPLGFLNPFMYANPHMFRDIQKGYNNGGGISVFKKGFYATKGWDPVTGLGTPNYIAIKAAALAAQSL